MTRKQQAFAVEYLVDMNATKAAERAGYSRKTAGVIGHELLKKPQIRQAIDEHRERVHSAAVMSYAEMCERLTAITRATVVDFLDENGCIDINRGYAPAIQSVDRVASGPVETTIKLRLQDQLRAMEQLSKLKGYNAPTKVAPTDPSGQNPYVGVAPADLAAFVAALPGLTADA